MMVVTVLIGLVGAGALLLAGFQLGVARGSGVRDDLRRELQGASRDTELRQHLQGLTRVVHEQEAARRAVEADMRSYLERLSAGSGDVEGIRRDLQLMLAPMLERGRADDDLRAAVHDLLDPLLQRERLGEELARLELGSGERGELPRLLDDIARRGNFTGVILSDEAGLPLAASTGFPDLERFTGLSSLLMLMVDRLAQRDDPAPLAVVVHDATNRQILNRVFTAAGQKLVLTAIATGTHLAPTALDPALAKVEALLVPSHRA